MNENIKHAIPFFLPEKPEPISVLRNLGFTISKKTTTKRSEQTRMVHSDGYRANVISPSDSYYAHYYVRLVAPMELQNEFRSKIGMSPYRKRSK